LGDPLLPFRDIFRLLAGDGERLSASGVLNREHALRLRQALPLLAQIMLDNGPHLLDTLVSSVMLEAHISGTFDHDASKQALLGRLHELRSRRFLLGEAELQQDRLFEEVSTTLIALSQRYPLLLILDDLHWADLSSVSLLAHLMLRVRGNAIFIIGSFRPEDLAQERPADASGASVRHPLQEVLNESRRRYGENRIDLDFGGSEEGRAFIDALLDVEPNRLDAEFRRRLASRTNGHPLFVVELVRDMKERGFIEQDDGGYWVESDTMNWDHIPARVEGVVEERLMRLPADLLQILTLGSLQGEHFSAELIAQVLEVDAHDLIRRLSDELDRQHRLVREEGMRDVGARRLSQYGFRHFLFQAYLYERLGVAERVYLHERTGNALETLYADNQREDEVFAAQLARHFQEARRAEKASHYLHLAGKNAARVLDFRAAAAHYDRGLSLLKDVGRSAAIDRLRFELELARAKAQWHDGRVADSLNGFSQAVDIARGLDGPEALARAALAYEDLRWRLNLDASLTRQILREALAAIEDAENALRVRLLMSLAQALLGSGEHDELRATVDEAREIARRIDDTVVLCDALRISIHIDRRPEATETRLAAAAELIAVAQSLGDKEREADGWSMLAYDHLELGNMEAMDESIVVHRRLAEEIRQPFQLHLAAVFQTMRAITRGAFAEAERLAREAARVSQQMGVADQDGIFGMHMFTIRREQGRLNQIAPLLELLIAGNSKAAAWRPGLALMYASLGMEKECRATFEELATDAFAGVARDSLWVTSVAYLAEVCTFLQDSERATMLYEWLLPYDGRAVVAGGATACYGAVARYLGMLAAMQLNWAAAEQHFEGALALDARMGVPPWLAHSQYEYAAMLLARGQDGDRRRAKALLEEAAAAAAEMAMAYLAQKVSRLQASVVGV
jgi:hypothetical protein